MDPKRRPGMEAISPTALQYQAMRNNILFGATMSICRSQDPTGDADLFL